MGISLARGRWVLRENQGFLELDLDRMRMTVVNSHAQAINVISAIPAGDRLTVHSGQWGHCN